MKRKKYKLDVMTDNDINKGLLENLINTLPGVINAAVVEYRK